MNDDLDDWNEPVWHPMVLIAFPVSAALWLLIGLAVWAAMNAW